MFANADVYENDFFNRCVSSWGSLLLAYCELDLNFWFAWFYKFVFYYLLQAVWTFIVVLINVDATYHRVIASFIAYLF